MLEKRNLLCEAVVTNPNIFFDFRERRQRLYYPSGKAFILETVQEIAGRTETRIITSEEAFQFMDEHPEGIVEKVYVRYFGEPEEV